MSWDDRAACRRTARPEAFFEVEEAADDDRAPDPDTLRFALSLCESCPVRAACEERARGSRSTGIWGGTFAADRGVTYGTPGWWKKFTVSRVIEDAAQGL